MQRRDFLMSSGIALVGGIFLPIPTTRHAPGITPLRRNVGVFEGEGGTSGWLISDQALVIVDSQQPPSDAAYLQAIRERSSRQIDFLINTHHHSDHTDGNPVFAPHTGHIVAHENVPYWQNRRAEERKLERNTVADTTLKNELSLHVGDEVVHLNYYGPAHTSGDVIVYFEKADVAHMGDLVFNRLPAYIDRPSGARIAGWMRALETAHQRFTDDTIFIFGHGKTITGTREDLVRMRDFLGGLLSYAEAGIKAGKTKEEIAETKQLPDFPDNYSPDWENGIPDCLRVAFEELTDG